MATRKKRTEIEKFKDVYYDLKVPDVKNINLSLDTEIITVYWNETGEVDSRKHIFELKFDLNNKGFNNLLKKDISGVLGWKGLPFNALDGKYFIKKEWGSKEEQMEILQKVFKAFVELDEKIDFVSEDAPQSFAEDAKKFNNALETEHFFIEYDTDNNRCYVVLKSKTFTDFNIFNRANVSPRSDIWPEEYRKDKEAEFDHKVKNLPGYKEKPHLKEYVRKKCFWIPASNYSMISESVRSNSALENRRETIASEWLNNEENWKRVKAVEITEPNPFKLIIRYDERKKVMLFSCPSFECTSYNELVTKSRDNALEMLFYNEVLCRPEKPTDINNRKEETLVAQEDDRDLWKNEDVFKGKVIFDRRSDSKGKVLYLEAEKNIDELEIVKANYEVFKEKYLKNFKEFVLPEYKKGLYGINNKYPTLFLDRDNGTSHLLFDLEKVLEGDGMSYKVVSKNSLEITTEEANLFFSKDASAGNYWTETIKNFKEFYLGYKFPGGLSFEQEDTAIEELKLSWHSQQVMNKFGFKMSVDLMDDEDDPNESIHFRL